MRGLAVLGMSNHAFERFGYPVQVSGVPQGN